MNILTTDKTSLSVKDIEDYIEDHMTHTLPRLNKLWSYYVVKNETIKSRIIVEPDNKTAMGYGRKIVNTYVGYSFKDGNIELKTDNQDNADYFKRIQEVYKLNHEGTKTNKLGRDTAVFGEAYELQYTKSIINSVFKFTTLPCFFVVDPREMIVIYDTQPEPELKFAIRYVKNNDKDEYKVEVYTAFDMSVYVRTTTNRGAVEYAFVGSEPHFYDRVPVSAYYMGDDKLGLIDPIIDLIDDYDLLVSDSMIEFKRFSNAYLRLVGMSFGDPTGQNPKMLKQLMDNLRYRRIFDRLRNKDDVTFLSKDIPKAFIEFMINTIRDQIHIQSHVPDFTSSRFTGIMSGVAIKRLLFDFENVCSSAESPFDLGLYSRLALITTIIDTTAGIKGDPESISIIHKRNVPLDETDEMNVAVLMKNAGLSMETILEQISRDMVPSIPVELARQKAEQAEAERKEKEKLNNEKAVAAVTAPGADTTWSE